LSGYSGISITNVYIPPSTNASNIAEFYEELSCSLIQYLSSHICIVAGDFNRTNTSVLSSLGLTDIVNFNTRENAKLDHVFTNNSSIFETRKYAPLGASDHCLIRTLPKIYSKSNHKEFTNIELRKIKWRNTSPENKQKLRDMLFLTDFTVFDDPSLDVYVDTFTEYLKFCYDVCCPSEDLLISNQRLSSPLLKQLRRRKEAAYKSNKKTEIYLLNTQIRCEIDRLNKKLTEDIFRSSKPADTWKCLKLLTNGNNNLATISADLDILNESFVFKPDTVPDPLVYPL
jgi:hypothetical protein